MYMCGYCLLFIDEYKQPLYRQLQIQGLIDRKDILFHTFSDATW